jgi:hypothetical protein
MEDAASNVLVHAEKANTIAINTAAEHSLNVHQRTAAAGGALVVYGFGDHFTIGAEHCIAQVDGVHKWGEFFLPACHAEYCIGGRVGRLEHSRNSPE